MHARALPKAVAALLAVVVSLGPLLLAATGQDYQRARALVKKTAV